MSLWVDNVTLQVFLGFGSGPLASSPTYTNVSADVKALTTYRGRRSTRRTFDPGSATIVLKNASGDYDPNNSTSPYAGDLNFGTPVRIRAVYNLTDYDVFYGHVSRWPIRYDQPNDSTVELEVTEGLALIRNYHLEDYIAAEESSDTRIDNILDEVGWPAARRDLDAGVSLVAAQTYTGPAGDLIDEAVQAEQGDFYIAANGGAKFLNRVNFSGAGATTTFGGVSGYHYANPVFSYDDDSLTNQAAVTPADDDTQESSDATSIADHGVGSPSLGTFTNASLINGAYALNVAEWLVAKHKDIRVRIDSFDVFPEMDHTNLYPTVLSKDIGSVFQLFYTPPAGDDIDQECKVESVQHEIRPGYWRTTFGVYPLADIETNHYFTVGTAELGDGPTLSTSSRIA